MVAAFLGLRLYSVLGRRAEHEEEPITGRIEDRSIATGSPTLERKSNQPALPSAEVSPAILAAERGLREIAGVILRQAVSNAQCERESRRRGGSMPNGVDLA